MGPEMEQPSQSYRHQVAERRGGPEILMFTEQPLRDVAPGEVRVRVEAAGVLLADVMWQQGTVPGGPKPPFTPGYDVTGRVEQVAGEVGGAVGRDGSMALSPGERVTALVGTGGYSEVAYVPVDSAVKVPDRVEPDAAAAVATGYLTGYAIVSRLAGLETGQSILVHAGAGATGSAILDVARLMGLKAFATASPAKLDVVRSFAADRNRLVRRHRDGAAGAGLGLGFACFTRGTATGSRPSGSSWRGHPDGRLLPMQVAVVPGHVDPEAVVVASPMTNRLRI